MTTYAGHHTMLRMPGPRSDTRDRMIRSAARLFQRQGYLGTGLVQVVEDCGAPRGSIYFHFRGGKEELALEVIDYWARGTVSLVHRCAEEAGDVAQMVVLLADSLAETMERSGFVQGCAVATTALEMSPASDSLRNASDRLFADWQQALRDHLTGAGLQDDRADVLGNLIVSTLEGALILARTGKTVRPLQLAGRELAALVQMSISSSVGPDDG